MNFIVKNKIKQKNVLVFIFEDINYELLTLRNYTLYLQNFMNKNIKDKSIINLPQLY